MNSPPLRVLVVSEDRKLLRQVSRFLNTFCYPVQEAAAAELAFTALEGGLPEVILLDSGRGSLLELCRQAAESAADRYVYTLLLVGDAGPRELAAAMAAGADDFLRKPIVFGELLTRLSAAARAIEQERRFRQQDGIDPLTHLINRQAFEEQIRRRSPPNGEPCCVVADLDLLGRINRVHGFAAGSEVIRAAARLLASQAEGAVVASFGGGRFGVLFENAPLEEAAAWAERAGRDLAALEIPLGETAVRVTASFGAAAGLPEQVLRRAEDALREAKRSGRDYVACHGQFKEEELAWAELAAPGKLFEQTAAHHVMTPLPLVLTYDQTAGRAAELLEATRLDALCVVDPEGRLAGIVTRETDLSDSDAPLMEVLDADAAAFDESTPFAAVFEFFTAGSQPLAVITRRGRPTGVITQEKLASLGEPAGIARFAPSGPYAHTSEYLVVVDRGVANDTL